MWLGRETGHIRSSARTAYPTPTSDLRPPTSDFRLPTSDLRLPTSALSSPRFILDSLVFHRRIHIAVALGVMTATAVLVGALLVGDSVRGSLRHLALDRLGKIDRVLVAPRFFREAAAGEFDHGAVPAILLQATLAHGRDQERRSAGQVTVIGCGARFWDFDPSSRPARLAEEEIVLNAPLAEKLGAKVGD